MTPRPRSIALCALLALLFALLAVLVARGSLDGVDGSVARPLHTWARGHFWSVDVARVLTWTGHPIVVDVGVALLVVVLLVHRRGRTAIAVLGLGLLSLAARSSVKTIIDRPRPHWSDPLSSATGGSFPSGHVAGAAFLATALVAVAVRQRRVVGAVAVGYVVLVAVTRVLLGVHWLSDVVGGAALGVAFGILVPAPADGQRTTDPVTATRPGVGGGA